MRNTAHYFFEQKLENWIGKCDIQTFFSLYERIGVFFFVPPPRAGL